MPSLSRINIALTALAAVLLLLVPATPVEAQRRERVIQLTPGQDLARIDGGVVQLEVQPFIDSGHTLVPLRFIGEALDLAVTWQAETRTVVLSGADKSVVLQVGQSQALTNGQAVSLPVPARISHGRTMVPLRFISEALGAKVDFDTATKLITITVELGAGTPPVARFSLSRPVILPGEKVEVWDESFHPDGVSIVQRTWHGLAPVYERAGRYEITLRVKDANGNWSEPYTRELIVNTPPVVRFRTDKPEYKIGQPVQYINESYDPDGHELMYRWTNRQPAFFEAGEHRVILEAWDPLGGRDSYELTVRVSEEVHYTPTEYYLLYGEPKKVIPLEYQVLDYPILEPAVEIKQRTLLKSNSPEEIPSVGLLYRDTVAGSARLMLHHVNKTGQELKIYVLAHNPATAPVTVTLTRQGLARPSAAILHQGREQLVRFFGPHTPKTIVIPPGKTENLLADLSAYTIKPGFCVSGLFDLVTSGPVEFSFVAVRPEMDPVAAFQELPVLAPDGQHVRGTFPGADRRITIPAPLARPNARLVLGDLKYDPPMAGIDALTGREVLNIGNYGAIYELVFEGVETGTAVLLNPRGGVYCGAVTVNGLIWETPVEGYLLPQRQAVILQRVYFPRQLRLEYSPPPGSYLPVNILLVELPENKETG
ncbi:MAG TPA: hypothetical protein DEA73_00815 [Peptococcaceae bacterium]|nr:hypothetical protein [Peptococcaceae bacterium]